MKQHNVAELVSNCQQAFLSYLKSAMPVGNHASQRELGKHFSNLWEHEIFKGPYVESLPSYQSTKALSEMQPTETGLSKLFFDALRPLYDYRVFQHSLPQFSRCAGQLGLGQDVTALASLWLRPLYKHQLQSLTKASIQKRNIIVATGTGSGKTECFLLPILHSLVSETPKQRQVPGVRAMLLYPMNALVEDQMARLRRLLIWLNLRAFDKGNSSLLSRPITFGRYTGQTPLDARDPNPEREASPEEIHELGEIRFRSEMQMAPPDILVTNFTMLEYMLIRNDDRNLFRCSEQFKFLVLDEVHTYSGTRGMEVATLLRRFRDFVLRDQTSQSAYQCIGTSATLGSLEDAKVHMASFANALFGAPFDTEDIIGGALNQTQVSGGRCSFNWKKVIDLNSDAPNFCRAYGLAHLTELMEDDEISAEEWNAVANALQADPIPQDLFANYPERNDLLGRLVASSSIVRESCKILESNESVLSLDELAEKLLGSVPADELTPVRLALARILQICAAGTENGRCTTAFRAHLFVREQRSAYVCINPNHTAQRATDDWWSDLSFVHRKECVCGSLMLPLYLCRKCGFVFLEGWLRDGKFHPERDELLGKDQFRRILLRPKKSLSKELLSEHTDEITIASLCHKCGQRFAHDKQEYLRDAITKHQCESDAIAIAEWGKEGGDAEINECPHCEQTWLKGQEVVSAPHISLYAASTILVEELKRALDEPLRGTGLVNKLLCFSDGRQQAAAIAARLQRTNAEFSFRQLLYRGLVGKSTCNTQEVISELTDTIQSDRALTALFCEREEVGDISAVRSRVATQLFLETCSEYRTIESLGLVSLKLPVTLENAAEECLRSDGLFSRLTESDRRSFFALMINWSFRSRRWAVHRGSLALHYEDLEPKGFQDRSVSLFGTAAANVSGFSLKVAASRNRCFDYYRRVCQRTGSAVFTGQLSDFQRIAESLWTVISAPQFSAREKLVGPVSEKPFIAHGVGEASKLKLNWFALRWGLTSSEDVLHCCETCNAHSLHATQAVCPVRSCSGRMIPSSLRKLEEDEFRPSRHYIRLLRDKEPKPLNVEEHTAQISARARREIEESFKNEEVGNVDVISGSTTFEMGVDLGNLNGVFLANMPPEIANYRQRAGRAGRRQGMLPIVLTYVRERPHDAYFWSRPKDFICGPVRVPRFRPASFEVLLRHANACIYAEISRRHPDRSKLEGPAIESFVQLSCGERERQYLRSAAAAHTTELFRALTSVLAGNPELQITPAICVENFFQRLDHFRDVYLEENSGTGSITVLSDYGILPSYSYPIYVDELRLIDQPASAWPRSTLKLQRDRSIALREYFPGRAIIANKIGIKSVGLWDGYDIQAFRFCRTCFFIDMRREHADCINGCGTMVDQKAVRPLGGFIGKYEPNLSRTESEVFNISGGQYFFDPADNPPPPLDRYGKAIFAARQNSFSIHKSGARMRTFTPRPDSETPLTLIRSQAVDRAAPRKGPRPCLTLPGMGNGVPEHFYLMHEFTTDIVRLQIEQSEVGNLLLWSDVFQSRFKNADKATKGKMIDMYRYTFAQALCTGGARYLGINPSDLAFTFRHTKDKVMFGKEIIIFDTAPGGAGYCDQLLDSLQDWFGAAAQALNCICGDSCYACLRSYENQQLHTRMDRLLVDEGLRAFNFSNWAASAASA